MIEGIDYEYIFPEKDDKSVHVKFLEGPYTDTIFKYGKVKVEEKDGQGYLLFAYDVLESPIKKPKKLEKDEDFKNYIGNLLVEIMTNNMEQEIVDENRTIDSEESDL